MALLFLAAACTPPKDTPLPPDTGNDSGRDTAGEEGLSVRRTAHGVVHVRASTFEDLGRGVGWAYTEDNRCLLAHRVAEVTGTLSSQLGPRAEVDLPVHGYTLTSLDSDRFGRGWLVDEAIAAGFDAGAPEVRDLAVGSAAGVNQWVAEHPATGEYAVELTRAVTPADVYRMWVATAEVASGEVLAPFVATPAPTAARRRGATLEHRRHGPVAPFGSNAWAIGRDLVATGGSVHVDNPHFPWTGIHRVWLAHLTIPGTLDVMGRALGGLPLPAGGFPDRLAWGLTFSNAARFTVAQLPLVAGDPRAYTVDGATRRIEDSTFDLDIGDGDTRTVSFFRSDEGPVLDAADYRMGWDSTHAYAVHDVNADNTRFVERLLGLARATSVAEARASLDALQGLPWSCTTVADADGNVLFGALSNVPDVTAEQITGCATSASDALAAVGVVVLDGARAACAWQRRMSAASLPAVERTDDVANSDNSHEVPNVAVGLGGYSPMVGPEGDALGLRPSLGLWLIEGRAAGADGLVAAGFTADLADTLFHQERDLAGELLAASIAADCLANPVVWDGAQDVNLTEACTILAAWDGSIGVDAVGAALFTGTWAALGRETSSLFAVGASLDDPLGTPAGYTEPSARRSGTRSPGPSGRSRTPACRRGSPGARRTPCSWTA